MDLRDYLLRVASTYDHTDKNMDSPAQKLLRGAPSHLKHLTPAGYEIIGSGGKGEPTFTPWVGFFNPDETTKPAKGLYLVYLFSKDLSTTTLMLQQGITFLREELHGTPNRRAISEGILREESKDIRQIIPSDLLSDWDLSVDLKSTAWRQTGYEAGNIAAREYDLSALPSEPSLRNDLWEISKVYDRAIEARATLSPLEERISDLLASSGYVAPAQPLDFSPKNDSDYTVQVKGGKQVRTRRHERLIGEYGLALSQAGFAPTTDCHPRDLMLSRNGSSWLVEAKVVRNGNPTGAVREALAQLFYYRHFLHRSGTSPNLAALFTEDIGKKYVDFLSSLNISSVWKTPMGWDGSETAVEEEIVPTG